MPASASAAWQAYNAMEATKARHFTYLVGLEDRDRNAGEPSPDETARLARLLGDHEEQAGRFKAAMRSLRAQDANAYRALLDYIARTQQALAAFR